VIAPEIYTPEVIRRGRKILAIAQQEAGTDPLASARVTWLEKGLQQVELVLAVERAYEQGVDTGDFTEFKAVRQELDNFREQNWDDNISNLTLLNRIEKELWDRSNR
jgi:hypothetical protein